MGVRSPAPSRLTCFSQGACLPQLRSLPRRLRPDASGCLRHRPNTMVGHVICHAINSADPFSAGQIIEAAERAFSPISDNRPALFVS
jgi:hypothetical protein